MAPVKKLWNVVVVTTSPETIEAFAALLDDDSLALSIFAPPRKRRARIEALCDTAPDKAALTARLAVIAAMHHVRMPKIEIREMPKLDWLAKVAGDFPPLQIGRWIIHGAQHRHTILRRRYALQIEAVSAFGTGEHPTTRGCLVMLEQFLKRTGTKHMLDMGCGSGILAMAWVQATHGSAIAVDLDPESVQVARDNIRVNGLQSFIKTGLSRGYNSPLVRQHAPYDLIMANIFAGPLCQMAKDLKRHLLPGGVAILSGILNHQANHVIAAHRMQGLHLVKRLQIGEWSVLVCHSHSNN